MKTSAIVASLVGLASLSTATHPRQVPEGHDDSSSRPSPANIETPDNLDTWDYRRLQARKDVFADHRLHAGHCKHAKRDCQSVTGLTKEQCTKLLKRAGTCWDMGDITRGQIMASNYDIWNHITATGSPSSTKKDDKTSSTKKDEKVTSATGKTTSTFNPTTTVFIPEGETKKPNSSASKVDSDNLLMTITTELVITRSNPHATSANTQTVTDSAQLEKRRPRKHRTTCGIAQRICKEEMKFSEAKCTALLQVAGHCLTEEMREGFRQQREDGTAGQRDAKQVTDQAADDSVDLLERRQDDNGGLEANLTETVTKRQLVVPNLEEGTYYGRPHPSGPPDAIKFATHPSYYRRPRPSGPPDAIKFATHPSYYRRPRPSGPPTTIRVRTHRPYYGRPLPSGPTTPIGVPTHQVANSSSRNMSPSPSKTTVATRSLPSTLSTSQITSSPKQPTKRSVKQHACMKLLNRCMEIGVFDPKDTGPTSPDEMECRCRQHLCNQCYGDCFSFHCNPPCKGGKSPIKNPFVQCDFKDHASWDRKCYVENYLTAYTLSSWVSPWHDPGTPKTKM